MNRTVPLALLLTIAVPAVAAADAIDNRLDRQAEWIDRGRDKGSITWTEGLKLRAEQNRIARTKAALGADGTLSRSDRVTLAKMQDEAARNIRSESRDGWHRLWGLPRVGK